MATENLKLGKETRVYIGKSAAATAVADFELVENENEVTCSYKADVQQISTKSAGKLTTPGDESWEIKFTTNEALSDKAASYLRKAKNKSWPYQVRDGSDVWLAGNFILTDAERKSGSVGVNEGSYTLQNSGTIIEHDLDTPDTND